MEPNEALTTIYRKFKTQDDPKIIMELATTNTDNIINVNENIVFLNFKLDGNNLNKSDLGNISIVPKEINSAGVISKTDLSVSLLNDGIMSEAFVIDGAGNFNINGPNLEFTNTELDVHIVNQTSNLILFNTNNNGSIINKLAANDTNVHFYVQDNNYNNLLSIDGTGNTIIQGDLTVIGTTTKINSIHTSYLDTVIELNNGATTNDTDIGILFNRGGAVENGFIGYDETADEFIVALTNENARASGDLTLNPATLRANNINISSNLNVGGIATLATGSTIGNLTLADGSITATSGSISFGNENLSTTGTLGAGVATLASSSTIGNLTLANGSISDSSGAISFGNENLSTTGTLGAGVATLASSSTIGNLTLANGSITDSSGAISFGNENISTTGTLGAGNTTITGELDVTETINTENIHIEDSLFLTNNTYQISQDTWAIFDTLKIQTPATNIVFIDTLQLVTQGIYTNTISVDGSISCDTISVDGSISCDTLEVTENIYILRNLIVFGDTSLASGTTIGNLTLGSGSITDSSGAISFGNENLLTTGTLGAGVATLASGSTIGGLTLADASITDISGSISFGGNNLSTTGTLGAGNTTITGELDVTENIIVTKNLHVIGRTVLGNSLTLNASNSYITVQGTDDTDLGSISGAIVSYGGLGVVKNIAVGKDIWLESDNSSIRFGADKDLILTHIHDTGLKIQANSLFLNETSENAITYINFGNYDTTNIESTGFGIRSNDGILQSKNFDGDWADIGSGGGSTTINNNANNRIITGSDTADTLEAEANLTYDGSSLTIGNLTLANGSITDSSGAISFGNENLSTTGTFGAGVATLATSSTIGNLTLANGSITDSSGAISFGNENLSTTGTLGAGDTTITGELDVTETINTENIHIEDSLFLTNNTYQISQDTWAIFDTLKIQTPATNIVFIDTLQLVTQGIYTNTISVDGSISCDTLDTGDTGITGDLEVTENIYILRNLIVFGDTSLASGTTIGNLTLGSGSITDSSGSISFGNENLSTTGTLGAGVATLASSSTIGNLTLANGSITDSSGAISFGNENLTTTGTLGAGVATLASSSTIGNLTLADSSITASSGSISFVNENLTTTGTLSAGDTTITGELDVSQEINTENIHIEDSLFLTNNTYQISQGSWGGILDTLTIQTPSNNGVFIDTFGLFTQDVYCNNITIDGDKFTVEALTGDTYITGELNVSENIIVTKNLNVSGTTTLATGTTIGNLTLADSSITASSGSISFGDENLTTTGTLDAGDTTITGTLEVSSSSTFNDNLVIQANYLFLSETTENAITYINFGNYDTSNVESTGFGLRSNDGILQYKNFDGTWGDIGSGGGTTINNNANNRIITGSDTADTLEAEATLTYDGTDFKINTDKFIVNSSTGDTDILGELTVSENIIVTKNLNVSGTTTLASGTTIGNLTLANGSITDSSGAISFGNENLSTTGTFGAGVATLATSSTIGNLTLANGSITDSSGAISFGNENLSTTGTLGAGDTTITGTLDVSKVANFTDNIIVESNYIFLNETTANAITYINFGNYDTSNIESGGFGFRSNDGIIQYKNFTGSWKPLTSNFLKVSDTRTSGTASGTFTSGSYQTKTLQTVDTNEIEGASLASNKITLPAGTYYCEAEGIGYKVNRNKMKLYNDSDSTDILIGMSYFAGTSVSRGSLNVVKGQFTLAAEKDITLLHRCETTRADAGYGIQAGFGESEVYAIVSIWKLY